MAEPMIQQAGVGGSGDAGRSRLLGPAALVSLAFLATNALSYVFTVLAARVLAPEAFGELAALLGVLLVATVPATGVQTAAALRLGRLGTTDVARVAARLHATAAVTGLAVAAAALLATAPLTDLLHLPEPAAVLWLAAALLPSTLVAGYVGILQGTARYGRLAAVNGALGAAKLAGGTAGLLLGGSATAALAGTAAGTALAAAAGWAGCGRPGLARGLRVPLAATARASGALLGFVLLLNLDLLLARHHLGAAAAGEYAVGAVVAKVAFWLPQGVGVVLLPRLADESRRAQLLPRALALVGASGAALTLGTAALGAAALPLIGGSAYGDALGSATWLFAALGTLLALAQLLLYSGIAAADHLGAGAVWAAALAEVAVVTALDVSGRLTVVVLVGTAVATASLLVAVGLLRARPRAAVRPEE